MAEAVKAGGGLRNVAESRISSIDGVRGALPAKTHPMTSLRTLVSALGAFDPEAEDASPEALLRKSRRLTAQMPTLVAGIERR